jgi:CubicO group peptidase (beta-lactamase class C family)
MITTQTGTDRLDTATRERIDAIFAQWDRDDTPGVAIGIYHDGETAYTRGYGMANLEHGIPITPDSVFHLASVSKQFAGFAIALLWNEGTLDIDADIRQWVPEVPAFGGATITLRHLMHHTSGLRDQWSLLDLAGWRQEDLVTESDVLDLLARQRELNFAPGERYAYCNTGYTLMAVIVHRVTGKTLRAFCQERIFGPLGMTRTHFHDDHAEIVRGRTQAYIPRDEGGYRISIPEFDVVGATSLFSTVEDFVHWDRHFTTLQLTTPETMAAFLEPATTTDGTETHYGWGITTEEYRGITLVGHGGADHGYRSSFLHVPEHNIGVTIFANLSAISPGDLAHRVIDVLLEDALTPATDEPDASETGESPADLARFAGIYRNASEYMSLIISEDDGNLVSGRKTPMTLAHRSGTTFAVADYPWISLEFGDGTATLRYAATSVDLQRVADGPQPVGDPSRYEGTFTSAELGVTWTVATDGDRLILKRRKRDDTEIYPIGDGIALIEGGLGASDLVFDATGLRYSTDRLRNLHFTRDA